MKRARKKQRGNSCGSTQDQNLTVLPKISSFYSKNQNFEKNLSGNERGHIFVSEPNAPDDFSTFILSYDTDTSNKKLVVTTNTDALFDIVYFRKWVENVHSLSDDNEYAKTVTIRASGRTIQYLECFPVSMVVNINGIFTIEFHYDSLR